MANENEKIAATYLNVTDWQVRGQKNISMLKGDECKPMTNPANGKEFFRVVMSENTILDVNGNDTLDISGYSFTIPAGSVRESKYGGKGLWIPEGWQILMTKSERQEDGTYKEVGRVTVGGPDDAFSIDNLKEALKAERKAYREAHPKTQVKEQANPKQDIAQGKEVAAQSQDQAKKHEQTISR